MAREQELERIERERIEKEVQERLDKERQEREAREKLARQQELEKERAEKERIEKEVQARVERERLERERREKLARERELERERAVKEQQAAEERHKQEIQEAENEILVRAEKEKNAEEARERRAQMERALDARNGGKEAQGGGVDAGEALKNGGRDLKENLAARADHGDGAGVGGVNAEAPAQGSQEKVRDLGEMDLRRRRRALGPGEAGGTTEETGAPRGVPGLEPLLELGGSDLHAALEEQLLAGAMVHSRQIKQASENEGAK